MERLFHALISFQTEIKQENRTGDARLNMTVARKSVLWWDHKNPRQDTMWGSWIELGEDFYEAITAIPVPVDIRALKALKQSPLALDLYAWLAHEAWRAHKRNKSRFVAWELLHQQFGGDYTDMRNFRRKVKAAMGKIRQVYPDLILGGRRGGIEILPGSLPAFMVKD